MSAAMWIIVWLNDDGTTRDERFWGTIEVEGQMVHLTHYSGGVAGFPRPMEERFVPLARIKEWRSDR